MQPDDHADDLHSAIPWILMSSGAIRTRSATHTTEKAGRGPPIGRSSIVLAPTKPLQHEPALVHLWIPSKHDFGGKFKHILDYSFNEQSLVRKHAFLTVGQGNSLGGTTQAGN